MPIRRNFVLTLAMLVSLAAPAFAQLAPFGAFNPTPNNQSNKPDLVQQLRQGGYVIFVRHARTDWSQMDADRQNLGNCATQRNLSDAGREQSRALGAAVRDLGIPIGDVIASPYCRTLETARLAFGRATESVELRHLFPENPANFEIVGTRLLPLLAAVPRAGCNTVLVSHGFNFRAAHGFDPAEGEAAILRPDGRGGHAYVGRLTSEDLVALAAAPPPALTAPAAC
jgi:broad specificity phosphatase PhoE